MPTGVYVRSEEYLKRLKAQGAKYGFKKGNEFGNRFKEGQKPWNTGLKNRPNMGFQKGNKINLGRERLDIKGDKNNKWKGEDTSITAKHRWIVKNYGNPPCCEDCGEEGYYIIKSNRAKQWTIQWSNCDHKYRRLREDYNGRCVKCHRKYDKS
jgi:hypothetical protein